MYNHPTPFLFDQTGIGIPFGASAFVVPVPAPKKEVFSPFNVPGTLKAEGEFIVPKSDRQKLKLVYLAMRQRCYNTSNSDYRIYGYRGIVICREWLDNFDVFYEWAISNGFRRHLTIDRIKSDGNYEPSNCRWATKTVQAYNRRGCLGKGKARRIRALLFKEGGGADIHIIAEKYNVTSQTIHYIKIGRTYKTISKNLITK